MPRERKGGWGGKRVGAGRPREPKRLVIRGTDAALLMSELHRLAAADVEMRQKLQHLAQAEMEQARAMAKMAEAVDRVLKHQAEISRELGPLERPTTPKAISRRRPLGG